MDRCQQLQTLYKQYQDCQNCILGKTRTNIVFGDGNPDTEILLLGEAPGKNEDIYGIPFHGMAGSLLDNYLEVAKATREDIYITNVIKCRPPNNRNPYIGEMQSCKEILDKQLKIIKPKIIITLGNIATKFILNTKEGITMLRGRWFEIRGYRIFPMFHPAALLRDGSKKQDMYNDFLIMKKEIQLMKNKKLLSNKILVDKSKKL